VFPRKVYYFTDSGRVLMKKITRLKNQTIFARESDYEFQLYQKQQEQQSDITLF